MSGVHSRLVLSTAATPTSPPAITRVPADAADDVVGRAGAEHQAEREREHHRPRLQRAVAVRELQELREGEDRAHHREEDEPHAERGDGERGSSKNRSGSIGAATRRSHDDERDAEHRGGDQAAEHERVRPPARRGLDDPVDQRHERGDREAGADEVERARVGVAALRDEPLPGDERDDDDRHVEPEHGAPREPLEQQAADERPEADADARGRRPDPDRLGALLAREDVHDDRERRGHDHRAADAHRGAQHDQLAGALRERGEHARDAEEDEPGLQRALAPEAVAERAHRQQDAGEGQQVGVDDPLQRRPPRRRSASAASAARR